MSANAITFNNTAYTQESLSRMSGPALVELYNLILETFRNGGNVPKVRRFADKTSAVTRVWKLLQRYAEANPEPEKVEEKATEDVDTFEIPVPKKKKPGAPKRGTNLQPALHAPIPCREGSKQAILLDMLSRPNGATMAELIDALSGGNKPWTEASVRSGFGWDMKLKGYGVRSSFDADGTERFHIVVPEGHAIPAHKPLKSAPKADARQTRQSV